MTENDVRTCPHCGGEIKIAAKLCKHCRKEVPEYVPPVPPIAPAPESPAPVTQKPKLLSCEACEGPVSALAKVCPRCGHPVHVCANCGQVVPIGQTACPSCQHVESATAPTTSSTPPVAAAAPQAQQPASPRATTSLLAQLIRRKWPVLLAVGGGTAIVAFLISAAIGAGPCGVVEKYVRADTLSERLQYVTHPDALKARWLSEGKDLDAHRDNKKLEKSDIEFEEAGTPKPGWKTVTTTMKGVGVFGADSTHDFFVHQAVGGWKVDYDSSFGVNPMSLAELKSSLPKQPKAYRVCAKLGDKYLRPFNNGYWSVDFSSDECCWPQGYIRKSEDEGKKLYELLKDGEKHRVIVEFAYPMLADRDAVIITKLVQEGWILDEEGP